MTLLFTPVSTHRLGEINHSYQFFAIYLAPLAQGRGLNFEKVSAYEMRVLEKREKINRSNTPD